MRHGCLLGMGGDFCVGCGEPDDATSLETPKTRSNWCVGPRDW
ncbi:hypothetical protein BURCENBC7_AP3665 [Burkholderia cenocepacia BC7]|nr:uncharacterized protein BCN122_II0709 [Burkholderia cenocepacia]EPZ90737.1 hypothetical protein BURCENK562V_C2640 [Burkholderia cenocepacia K56-2Valvano]ERI27848.1 hypothetical protein BURCENBC7_AP3665 [Burkholderia cenocepacia BC7]